MSLHINPSEAITEKIIKYLMKKYKLGSIDASCIYFDVITAIEKETNITSRLKSEGKN